jgi:hypothetical protein
MEAALGAGNVPAYRGVAYIVFNNLQLGDFGNRLPNLSFEIAAPGAALNPVLLGKVDANICQHIHPTRAGGLLPIIIEGTPTRARRVLVGGSNPPDATRTFEIAEYDVSGDVPVEMARTTSASFAINAAAIHSWAMAPDGRYLALMCQDSSAPYTNYIIVYDIVTRQMGDVFSIDLSSDDKQLAWIDAQHFVLDTSSGGVRGLQVFARAGMNIVDLGFFGVWGASSATSRYPLYYTQFSRIPGGLLNYQVNTLPVFTAMYARPIYWQNGALAVGDAYTVIGTGPSAASGPNPMLLRTAEDELTFCYVTTQNLQMFSFQPTPSGVTITRPWQTLTSGLGTDNTYFPVVFGNRLAVLHRPLLVSDYHVADVSLDSGSFTWNGSMAAANGATFVGDLNAIRIGPNRLLAQGLLGFDYEVGELSILERASSGDTLENIASDILDRAGYDPADYDCAALSEKFLEGYVLQEPVTARSALEPLQLYDAFDLVESGDRLVAVLHDGVADETIAASEARAARDDDDPPPLKEVTRAQELDLPAEITVDTIDPSRDYEVGSQRARRIVTRATSVEKIRLPIVCTADKAKKIAETRLFTAWAERDRVKLSWSRRHLAVEPGDVIDFDGQKIRIVSLRQFGGLIEAEGLVIHEAALDSTAEADGGEAGSRGASSAIDSLAYLMDLPLLRRDDDQPGFYATLSAQDGWPGGSLYRSADGTNFTALASFGASSVAGIATTALASRPADYMDRISTVNVQLLRGSLASCTEAELLNGANAALLGDEIIQFQTAVLVGGGLYTLSNLLRGRRGTEAVVATHAAGEHFVLLTEASVQFLPALLTDRARAYYFRTATVGQSVGTLPSQSFAYGLKTIQPFAPSHLSGTRVGGTGTDLTLGWKRRARLDADWADYVDVPLDETSELYDVEIMNGGSVMRTFSNVNAPSQLYTAAQQASDWGVMPSSFTVRVYQLSDRYGRGQAAEAVV